MIYLTDQKGRHDDGSDNDVDDKITAVLCVHVTELSMGYRGTGGEYK